MARLLMEVLAGNVEYVKAHDGAGQREGEPVKESYAWMPPT
jgi:hypothetical protein